MTVLANGDTVTAYSFTVQLSAASAQTVTVGYASDDNTASAGSHHHQ